MPDSFPVVQIGGAMMDFDALHTVSIDYAHQKTHEGKSYHAGRYFGTVADLGTAILSLGAGTIAPHVLMNVSVGGNADVIVTEGGTITGGTAVTIFNKNRNSDSVCLATAVHSGTLTGGTVIYSEIIPGGSGPKPAGGNSRSEAEWMIRTSKLTTIQVINVSGAAFACSVGIDFYEDNE